MKNSDDKKEKESLSVSNDLQSAQVLRQAIKDDEGLSAVAKDIKVTVKGGAITLDGEVSTTQEMNLATNTATAVGKVDEINNRIVVKEDLPAGKK